MSGNFDQDAYFQTRLCHRLKRDKLLVHAYIHFFERDTTSSLSHGSDEIAIIPNDIITLCLKYYHDQNPQPCVDLDKKGNKAFEDMIYYTVVSLVVAGGAIIVTGTSIIGFATYYGYQYLKGQ